MARPMTLATMRSDVYARLGEQSGFFTDAQINLWLNDGMDDISIRLEPKVSSATLTTSNATTEYVLPDNLISIKTVLYKDTSPTPDEWREVEETTYLELFRSNPDWENDTIALLPTHWYWRTQKIIGLYPQPVTGTTAGLRIIYTCRPDEMDADADTTTLPDYLDRVIVLYAVFRCKLKDRNDQSAIVARTEWEQAISQAASLINKNRTDHAPQLFPEQKNYRSHWYSRVPRFRAWTGSS